MSKDDAKLILQCWLDCPYKFGGICPKRDNDNEDEEWCELGCWTKSRLKNAVKIILDNTRSPDY